MSETVFVLLTLLALPCTSLAPNRNIFIVRHGDKLSDCSYTNGTAKGKVFGNNPPLTAVGFVQAQLTAEFLAGHKVDLIISSPFARTQQTALPLALALGLPITLAYPLSEDRQQDGAYRVYNTALKDDGEVGLDDGTAFVGYQDTLRTLRTSVCNHMAKVAPSKTTATGAKKAKQKAKQSKRCETFNFDSLSHELWYPEGDDDFWERVSEGSSDVLDYIFNTSNTNIAMFTHATPAFSFSFGMSQASSSPESFLNVTSAIAPAGIFHFVLAPDRSLLSFEGPLNFAYEKSVLARNHTCTDPYKPDSVGKYWPPSKMKQN